MATEAMMSSEMHRTSVERSELVCALKRAKTSTQFINSLLLLWIQFNLLVMPGTWIS